VQRRWSVGVRTRWPMESGDRTGGGQRWTAAARLQALITTAGMDEATRSGWCREQGLYPAELAAWQQDAIAGLGEPRAVSTAEARQNRRRVKDLERELHRKDRALAETAALLVLSKNELGPAPACRGRNGSCHLILEGSGRRIFGGFVPGKKRGP